MCLHPWTDLYGGYVQVYSMMGMIIDIWSSPDKVHNTQD